MYAHDMSSVARPWQDRVTKEANGCWVWQGATIRGGYGTVRRGARPGKLLKVHRLAWAEVNGPIPDGMLVLHRCDNPPCCNPAHLFIGTDADNKRDMFAKGRDRGTAFINKTKTHCKHGHPYTEENTYVWRGGRHCRKCAVEASRRYSAKGAS